MEQLLLCVGRYCGDVRSRTSYNKLLIDVSCSVFIVVTFDLGRVTTEIW